MFKISTGVIAGYVFVFLLSTSCSPLLRSIELDSAKTTEDKCGSTLAELFYQKFGNLSEEEMIYKLNNSGISIGLRTLTAEQMACLPIVDQAVTSVETYLKWAEAGGSINYTGNFDVMANVEVYLKYAEAMGVSGPDASTKVVASVETFLKYAEAVGYTSTPPADSTFKTIASVETYLKYAEAMGGVSSSSSKVVVASIETYLKYSEATGVASTNARFFANEETISKLGDPADASFMSHYDANLYKGIFPSLTDSMNSKGIVVEGSIFWNTTSTLVSKLLLKESTSETYLLDKGIVIEGAFDSTALNSFGFERVNSGDRLQDQGIVYNSGASEFASLLHFDLNSSVGDSQGVVGTNYEVTGSVFNSLNKYSEFTEDRLNVLGKGLVTTDNSKVLVDALILSRLITPQKLLDSGIIYLADSGRLLSVENYLKELGL